ncbi:OLC1v1001392C1 [Oldenlandia corymbosa var. corymbosa]|uniref:OLC1v1001392C1 n=1 Tax=Oldenlandia corymbosa var. corymbosa TaxID=529605 RepID=A0AAV1D524_OLDCO|nr:OLC1v1001392C1 [Oldenlandia corymbosa var. corymbosa]
MIGFSLPIAALANILTITAATLSLIAQLAETRLMTVATLRVMPIIVTSIIVVAFAGFVSPIVALVEIVPAVVGSTKTMLVRTEPTPMITEPTWTLSIVEFATAYETGLTVKSHELIEAGSLSMIDAELILETMLFGYVVIAPVASALLLNHYSDAESVVSEPTGPVSLATGTASILTAQIVLSTDRLAETLLAMNRTAGYALVIGDSVVTAMIAVERSSSAAEIVGTHDQKP